MNLRVQAIGRGAAKRAGDERDSRLVVNGRFMFGQHDQRRSRSVQARVHARGDLDPSRERQSDMDPVAHRVGGERLPDLLDDRLNARDLGKRQCQRRIAKPVKMFDEPEDPALVDPQAFPNGIAALHGGIKRADSRLIAMDQAPLILTFRGRGCGRRIAGAWIQRSSSGLISMQSIAVTFCSESIVVTRTNSENVRLESTFRNARSKGKSGSFQIEMSSFRRIEPPGVRVRRFLLFRVFLRHRRGDGWEGFVTRPTVRLSPCEAWLSLSGKSSLQTVGVNGPGGENPLTETTALTINHGLRNHGIRQFIGASDDNTCR